MNTQTAKVERKFFMVIIIGCLMAVLTQAGISFYLPSFPALQQDFHTTNQLVAFTLTSYMAGYALLMLLWGALGDAIGRRRALFIALLTFISSSVLLAYTHSIILFILLRFLQGAGGGGCAIIGRAAIRDVFEKAALVKAMSYVSIAFVAALGVFQAFGGEIQHFFHWRYDFLIMTFMGVIALLLVWRLLPETFNTQRNTFRIAKVFSQYGNILRDKKFLFAAIGGGIGLGITITFNVVGPFLLQNELHLTPAQYGYLGVLISISYLLGIFVVNRWVEKLGSARLIQMGVFSIILFGMVMLLFALIKIINVYVIILPLLLITAGQALIYPASMGIALQHYKNQAGYATALFGFVQQMLCSLAAAVAACLPHTTQLPLSLLIISIGAIAFLALFDAIYPKR